MGEEKNAAVEGWERRERPLGVVSTKTLFLNISFPGPVNRSKSSPRPLIFLFCLQAKEDLENRYGAPVRRYVKEDVILLSMTE
jgi:hypothetical protein